jgi:lysophospholipase L1-like esterase
MPVNHLYNRIENSSKLNSLFLKLYELSTGKRKKVNIVHLGDSHVQADHMTGYIRQKLRTKFGNGGRGLVFPYQLAKSNAPPDVLSNSNITWEFNRLAHPEINIGPGISGFVIKTSSMVANIDFELNQSAGYYDTFDKINLFIDNDRSTSWIIKAPGSASSFYITNSDSDSALSYRSVLLDTPTDKFSMASIPSDNEKYLYGISLENNMPGLIYHSLGVNGARYEQFNNTPLFWNQLSSLNADLYIVSFGTNEAQKNDYSDSTFLYQVKSLIANLNTVSPGIPVLITTAPDTFKNSRPNRTVADLNKTLSGYCRKTNIPLWDLFNMNTGSGSCKIWYRKGLMNHDKIHFKSAGYKIFGEQFYNVFMKAYNDFARTIR